MKLFTPEEANEALEMVRPLTAELVRERRRLERRRAELGAVRAKVAGNGGDFDNVEISQAQDEADEALTGVEHAIAALDELGVQVKDLDRGLIDFPALHPADGAIVLLCWHLGEDGVRFWHGVEEGFAGRKPLPF